MAQLWIEQRGGDIRWAVASLDGGADVFALTGDADRPIAPCASLRRPSAGVVLSRGLDAHGAEAWRLYAAPEAAVTINGAPQVIGMRVLKHKDRIHLAGQPVMFFSTERPAVVTPFPGADRPVKCPRCRRPIAAGTPAVRCPNPACGAWHHQDKAGRFECWTYDDVCGAGCNWPTELSGEYQWTPNDP